MWTSILMPFLCIFSIALCQDPPKNDTHSRLTPELLIALGVKHQNTLLQLLGNAFIDTRRDIKERTEAREMEIFQDTTFPDNATFLSHVCELLVCEQWAGWSKCETGPYEFSMMVRLRSCGSDNALCKYPNEKPRIESQAKACRRGDVGGGPSLPIGPINCPTGYEKLNGKYCLKYVSSTTSQSSASNDCARDGAKLIRVDSAEKNNALQKLLGDRGITTSVIWLNGKRDYASAAWEFTYGDPSIDAFEKWSPGEPSNGSSELCMVEEGSNRYYWDRECSNSYAYVCEYV